MSLTIRERRALTQRRLTPTDWQQARDEEMRSAGMLFGAIVWTLFVLVCSIAGIVLADWWAGNQINFFDSIPTLGSLR